MTATAVSRGPSHFPLYISGELHVIYDCCSCISGRLKRCKGFLHCASAFISGSPAALPPSVVDPLMKVAAQLPKGHISQIDKLQVKHYTVYYLTPC